MRTGPCPKALQIRSWIMIDFNLRRTAHGVLSDLEGTIRIVGVVADSRKV